MTKRPQIGHDRTSGQEIANDEIGHRLEGGQSQVGVPEAAASEVELSCSYTLNGAPPFANGGIALCQHRRTSVN